MVKDEKVSLSELKAQNSWQEGRPSLPDTMPLRWEPSPQNVIKLNWDATVDRVQSKIG